MSEAIAPSRSRRAAEAPAPEALAILEALPAPVLVADADERIRFANSAASLALDGRRLEGRTLSEAFAGASAAAAIARAALARNQTLAEADAALDAHGALRGDLSAAPLPGGRFVVVTIALKPRARTALEARPVPALARTLAHEVRNPLAGIRAAAQLIGKSADGETAELADLICAETDRIRRLTDRIDALEGLPPPRLEPINVHLALDRVRRIIRGSFPEVAIAERFDPSLPPILGDLDQLIQAILNLAKNGAEAAIGHAAGPRLTLSTAYRPGVRVRSAPGGGARAVLEIGVEDNGPGLPPAMQARAFEPFFTTKRSGQGLGLAVTAEIVARHDGRIEFESAPGRTIFKVLLPIETEAA